MLKKKYGFTLIEVLAVVVIVGVLAGLAIPSYFNTVEEARANEARVNLQIIRAGQKVFALNDANKNYWNPGTNPAVATINSTLNVDITTQFYDVTSITADNAATPKTFTATATRNATQGGNGRTITINEDGDFG